MLEIAAGAATHTRCAAKLLQLGEEKEISMLNWTHHLAVGRALRLFTLVDSCLPAAIARAALVATAVAATPTPVTAPSFASLAQPEPSTISVGDHPVAVDVNPTTNRVYVVNQGSQDLTVIDGDTEAVVATVPLPGSPVGVSVNAETDRVYVLHAIDGGGSQLAVLDGSSDTLNGSIPIVAGSTGPLEQPIGAAADQATNRIYVTLRSFLSIIDGNDQQLLETVYVGTARGRPAVDTSTNRVYVPSGSLTSGSIISYEGRSGLARDYLPRLELGLLPPLGQPYPPPHAVALDTGTGRLYVAWGEYVVVIDRDTGRQVTSIPLIGPGSLAIDSVHQQVYVATGTTVGATATSVEIIDEDTNQVRGSLTPGANIDALAVNPTTSRLYTVHKDRNAISVLDVAQE
jgi:YVTN family beta-propeller protein